MPGKTGARMPERLRKLGYQERSIQDSHQYSAFCRNMDKEARAKHEQAQEAKNAYFEQRQRAERSELESQLKTDFGRAFYREALRKSRESGYSESYTPGSHLEGYEYDSSRGSD